jgi:hypothetical protein
MRINTMSFLLLGVTGVSTAWSQVISFGGKIGIPVLDATVRHDESRPLLVGPSVEVRLPGGFALEADAIYHRVGSTTSFIGIAPSANLIPTNNLLYFIDRTRGNSWEFPVLGKYYFRRDSAWQPFVSTGWALRTVSFHTVGSENTNSSDPRQFFTFNNRYTAGVDVGGVIAVGVRYHLGRLKLAPEFRYTRWGSSDSTLSKNQAGVILGISF